MEFIWKRMLRSNIPLGNPNIDLALTIDLNREMGPAGWAYDLLIADKYQLYHIRDKWSIKTNIDIQICGLKKYFLNVYKILNVTKLRNFHYRL